MRTPLDHLTWCRLPTNRVFPVLLALGVMFASFPVGARAVTQDASHAPAGTLMEVRLDRMPPDGRATIGMVRTTLREGGTFQTSTGSGPAVHFIEEGRFLVEITEGTGTPLVVRAGTAGEAGTPEIAGDAGEITLEAGDGLVLPPGATATLSNSAGAPSVILDLLAAPDATTSGETGVSRQVLVSGERDVPSPPVTVTLSLVRLAPNARLSLPEAPAMVVYAPPERADALLLSGAGFNRGDESMEVYILSIAPAG